MLQTVRTEKGDQKNENHFGKHVNRTSQIKIAIYKKI